MASPLFPLLFTSLLLFLALSLISLASSPSFTSHPLCHRDEILALLQFKEGLTTNICNPYYSFTYPKLDSWKIIGDTSNCCLWDGVKCDDTTGHIVGLDLNSSCLYGSLSFNGSLSQLLYLHYLNLANNNFTHSSIPSILGHFSQLTYLDLSNSVLSGQIPSSISQLSKLSVLALSYNEGLMFKKQHLQTLLQNLTELKFLSLDEVEIPSTILETMTNLSSLIYLSLGVCGLYGEFPAKIFHLPNLIYISMAGNEDLGGYLPQFNSSSLMEVLELQHTRFDGLLPASIGKLRSLHALSIYGCGFSGQVPTSLGNLTQLRYLVFSMNSFERLDPSILSWLGKQTKLTTLGLSNISLYNENPAYLANLTQLVALDMSFCQLSGPFLSWLFKMTNLKYIDLSWNELQGSLPDSFSNLIQLISLNMSSCQLSGPFPSWLFKMNNLRCIDLSLNEFQGSLQDSFSQLTELQFLNLASNNFQGENPSSIFHLKNLKVLWLESNNLSGKVEINEFLRLEMNNLQYIDLSWNELQGSLPDSVSNLTQLISLNMSSCQLSGPFPSWLFKMNNLRYIDISLNELQGSLPDSFSQLTELQFLNLASNNFQGEIPSSIFHLKNLKVLWLESNNLSGKVEINEFLRLEKLTHLFLSYNHLSLVDNKNINSTVPKLRVLGLGSCNLQHFPYFLRDQDQLYFLNLSNNNIHGQIPVWMWNASKDTLQAIDLSGNFLTGFELDPLVFPWASATIIHLSDNMFRGPLPLPPSTTKKFWVSGNNFRGQISPHFCTLSDVHYLDLSNNSLSGEIPSCLGNFSTSLQILSLGGNNFHGNIPQTHTKDCNLKVLMLDDNNLKGQLPKSLSNCSRLEFLSLGSNQIDDAFPSWLGMLQELKVLILSSNQFHGELTNHATGFEFPKLHIIDLSLNNLSGPLPTSYFSNWNAMKVDADNGTFLQADVFYEWWGECIYAYSMLLKNKGIIMAYHKILEYLVAIDLSGNRFEGHIPMCIGSLKNLRLLNLSNNMLTGHIPSSLANLSKLEALDLSQNKLSGEIPPELVQLTFLAFFNASHNHLKGHIPQGAQFDTFSNDSYEGNPGLCGNPLSKKCGTPPPPPSISEEDDHSEGSPFQFGWMPVAIGFTCGFVIGLGIGHVFYTRKHEWVVQIFGAKQRTRKVVRGVRQWN